MNRVRLLIVAAVCIAMFAACNEEKEQHINVDASQLTGLWVKSGTQEYWRYKSDGTGATWDESEDVSEDETNFGFKWTLSGDEITHTFTGRMNYMFVPKIYVIKEISTSRMKWRDADYDDTYTLNKVD